MLFILFFHTRSIVFKVWSYTFCGKVLAIWDIRKVWCHWNLPSWTSYKASHGESFTRVSFAFNSLPHMHFWWHNNVLMKREELGFMGMKLSWHCYQLFMSHRIKCLWNYGIKLSIENGCFIQVSFHSIWHGSLENNAMKLSTETGLNSSDL